MFNFIQSQQWLKFQSTSQNNLSHNELFKIFDWTIYSKEQSQIISVSIREWELNKKHRQTYEVSSQARITLLNPNNGTIMMVCEETKYAIEKCMPLKETLRLDLYFDNNELMTLSLLSCACIEFICKSNKEYCILKFIPHERRQPPLEENDKESSKRKSEKSIIELEMELTDTIYRYGGEDALQLMTTNMPQHVISCIHGIRQVETTAW